MPNLEEVIPHIISTPKQQHPAVPAPPQWEITRVRVEYDQHPYRWLTIELWDLTMKASCQIKDFDFTDTAAKIRQELEKHLQIGIPQIDMERLIHQICIAAGHLGAFYDINEAQLKKFEER